MTAGTFLIALTLVVLVLLLWHLRWVLLVLFGAVVVATTTAPKSTSSTQRRCQSNSTSTTKVSAMRNVPAVIEPAPGVSSDPTHRGSRLHG